MGISDELKNKIVPQYNFLQHADAKTENGKTVGEILDSLNEEQRNVVNWLLYKALGFAEDAAKNKKE